MCMCGYIKPIHFAPNPFIVRCSFPVGFDKNAYQMGQRNSPAGLDFMAAVSH